MDWWRCFRLGPVSGRYEGRQAGPWLSATILDLRVDIDQRYSSNSPVLNRISADVYAQRPVLAPADPVGPSGPMTVARTYVESWILDAPQVEWSRCRVEITGSVRYWLGSHPPTRVKIVIPWTQGAVGPAQVSLEAAGAATLIYSCAFRSDNFRDVVLETDYCRSVNQPPQLPAYDTHAHGVHPVDTPQRLLTVENVYREAGIGVSVAAQHTDLDDSAAGFASWSPAELHDAMEQAYSRFPEVWPAWHLWGLLAGAYDDPKTGGLMFDAGAQYGGAGRGPDRQGFAVFRAHRWFDSLVAQPPTSQNEAAAMRQFLYTWAHEAGHAFNLLHSWNKARPDALSWMNYPSKYDARNGQDSFWSEFRFRFDDQELLHIRHGDRASVIMGGDPWASGGHLDAPTGGTMESEPGSPLELLLRSKPYFGFMEPVEIEARLRNRTTMFIDVDGRLDPRFGNTVVYVKDPSGDVAMFNPVVCELGEPSPMRLEPLATDGSNEGRDRYSAPVLLTYGTRGFMFDRPGRYEVRIAYSSGGILLTSNTLRIRIGRPMSREEDRFAQVYFTPDVGLTLAVDGSQSPFLADGMSALREAAERFQNEDLGVKAGLVVARSVGDDFFRRQGDRVVKTHTADPAEAIAITQPALDYYRETTSSASNLAYNEVGRFRATMLAAQGSADLARQELGDLREDLAARGVNQPVLDDIRALAETLEIVPTTSSLEGLRPTGRSSTGGGAMTSQEIEELKSRVLAMQAQLVAVTDQEWQGYLKVRDILALGLGTDRRGGEGVVDAGGPKPDSVPGTDASRCAMMGIFESSDGPGNLGEYDAGAVQRFADLGG